MKKPALHIVILAILVIPAISIAESAVSGAYISGLIGVQAAKDTDASSTDFVTGNAYNDRVEFDPGLNIGVTGGYDFGIVRLEGELSYKNAEIKAVTNQVTSERFHDTYGDVGVMAMIFNGFIDLHNNTPVTPYFGGGIGFASVQLSDTLATRRVGNTAQRVLLYGAGDDTVFAYQFGGGVDIAMNRHFSLDIGYRYFSANRAHIDSDQDILTNLKFASHTTALGFKYRY